MEYLLDQDEVNELIRASFAPYVEPNPKEEVIHHVTFSREETLALINGTYDPTHFKHLR